jgi:predicted glycosyltransferase
MRQPDQKIVIDIGHPAHVHLFRHLAKSLQEKGWDFLSSLRKKGESEELLSEYVLKYAG